MTDSQVPASVMFASIHHSDVMTVLTSHIEQTLKQSEHISNKFDFFEEQEDFLDFIYSIANKERGIYIPKLIFNGNFIKTAVVFVSKRHKNSRQNYLDLLIKYQLENYNTIILFALGKQNSQFVRSLTRNFAESSEYNLDILRNMKSCPKWSHQTIIRLWKSSDLLKTGVSLSYLEKIILPADSQF